jgi:hypothetical protein
MGLFICAGSSKYKLHFVQNFLLEMCYLAMHLVSFSLRVRETQIQINVEKIQKPSWVQTRRQLWSRMAAFLVHVQEFTSQFPDLSHVTLALSIYNLLHIIMQ